MHPPAHHSSPQIPKGKDKKSEPSTPSYTKYLRRQVEKVKRKKKRNVIGRKKNNMGLLVHPSKLPQNQKYRPNLYVSPVGAAHVAQVVLRPPPSLPASAVNALRCGEVERSVLLRLSRVAFVSSPGIGTAVAATCPPREVKVSGVVIALDGAVVSRKLSVGDAVEWCARG